MGITKQMQLEQWAKEQQEFDREHEALGENCPICSGELDREDCEALEHAGNGDD
jgi:hypothetical protein